MPTPLVSVCMTAYNHAAYLREAVEGVLAQEAPFGIELVLGEDCSTDATAEICREYVRRYPDRVRLVTGPRNVGWRANYRRTFDACRGRYVAYCDGDDFWTDSNKLVRQVGVLEADPDCGMCYTRTERFYPETGERRPFPPELYTDFGRMLRFNPVDNCCAVARRELIARYYDEVHPERHPEWLTDDTPMWLWFAARSSIRAVDAVTAVHRVLTGSVSHGRSYGDRLAFNDSIWAINLFFARRYGAKELARPLVRKRFAEALWLLAREGTVGEYLVRWVREVAAAPELLLRPEGYGLLAKRILLGRKKHSER